MSKIPFACPHCFCDVAVEAQHVGMEVQCGNCGGLMQVPIVIGDNLLEAEAPAEPTAAHPPIEISARTTTAQPNSPFMIIGEDGAPVEIQDRPPTVNLGNQSRQLQRVPANIKLRRRIVRNMVMMLGGFMFLWTLGMLLLRIAK